MGNHISRTAPVTDSVPPPHQFASSSSRDASEAEDVDDGGHTSSCNSWFSCGAAGSASKRRPMPAAVDVNDREGQNKDGLSRTSPQVQRSDITAGQQQQQQPDFHNMSIGDLIQLHSSVSNSGVIGFSAAGGASADLTTNTTIVKPQSPSSDIAFGASKLAFLRGTIFNSFMTEHELAYLAYKSELRTFSAGSVLYSQGSDSTGELFILCSGDLCLEIENAGVSTPALMAAMKDEDDIVAIDPIPQATRSEDRSNVPVQVGEQEDESRRRSAEHSNAISRLLGAAASFNMGSNPSQPSSSPPRIFQSNVSTTVVTAASSPEHTNASNSPRMAPTATPIAPLIQATTSPTLAESEDGAAAPMFHRLALQKAGWIFGYESLYKLPRPPANASGATSVDHDYYNFPLNAQSSESSVSFSDHSALRDPNFIDYVGDNLKRVPSIPRLANVVSTTDAMCLTLSREKMLRFFRRFPRLYDPFLSACGAHIEHCIDNLPFLSHMSPAKLKLFASLFSSTVVAANTVLFEENDPSTDESNFYFLHSGTVKLRLPASKVSITGFRPKSAMGMKSAVSPAVQSLTISALASATSPLRSEQMSSTSTSTPNAGSPASLTPLAGGVKLLDSTNYEQVLEAGSFFGELALLLELPRIATISTATDCIVFTIPRQTLRNFIQLVPDSLPRFRETVGSFSLQTTYLLQIPSVASAFYDFCAKEFSTENLDFVKACARFKSMSDAHLLAKLHKCHSKSINAALSPHQSDSRRSIVNEPSVVRGDEVTPINGIEANNSDVVVLERLPKIFETLAEEINREFISQLAPRQVNLSAKARSNIAQMLAEHRTHPDMFLEATREIHSLMNADSFIRFRKDRMFHQALNHLNKAATVVHYLEKWEQELQQEMTAREELEAVAIDAGILPPTSAYLSKKDGASGPVSRLRHAESWSSKPSSPRVSSKTINVSYWNKDFTLPAQARTADIVAFNEVRKEKQREALAEASYLRSLNKSSNSNSGASSKATSRRGSDNALLYDLHVMQTDSLAPIMIHRPVESVEGGVPLTMSSRSRSHGPPPDKGIIDAEDNHDGDSTFAHSPHKAAPVSPTLSKNKDNVHSPQSARRAFLKDKLKAELLEHEFAHLT